MSDVDVIDSSLVEAAESNKWILRHQVARMPWGEPISPEVLSRMFVSEPPIRDFSVDEASIIEGRHSTTFRLLLDRPIEGAAETYTLQGGMPSSARNLGETKYSDPRYLASKTCGSLGTGGGSTLTHELRKTAWPTSVYVKKMVCRELPERPLLKWRSSISSYRAEASFFKALAGSPWLSGVVPRCFWVHVDDRRDMERHWSGARSVPEQLSKRNDGVRAGAEQETGASSRSSWVGESEIDTLRASSFMIVTEDLAADPIQASRPEAAGEGASVAAGGRAAGGWMQVGAMDVHRARFALSAAARLHAVFWRELWLKSHNGLDAKHGTTACSTAVEHPVPVSDSGEPLDSVQTSDSQPAGQIPDGDTPASCGGRSRYAPGLHEQGTFWSLDKRDPGDVAGLEEEFDGLMSRFRALLPASWFDRPGGTSVAALGRRLAARARDLDAAARGIRTSGDLGQRDGAVRGGRGRTLVHGDLKTWNMFFRSNHERTGPGEQGSVFTGDEIIGATSAVKFIDWQWCGEGLAAADVAYLMCTSIDVPTLAREEELLEHYYTELCAHLGERRSGQDGGDGGNCAAFHEYSREEFREDYRVVFLDYVRCVVGTLWKGLTPEKMARNMDAGPGMSLINRSVEHMAWIIRRATHLLDELDGLGDIAADKQVDDLRSVDARRDGGRQRTS